MDLKPGDRLSDNLELEREIGSGGMGSVWIARNEALGSRVAVKVLQRLDGAKGAQQRARFEQEAKVVAGLDHPNIVKVFDLGVTIDGDPFIVMELLKGEDLGERVRRGTLSVADTRAIVSQACGALSCAHAAGVVHRDIKPANIFLVEGANAIFVKVVDFGVAKLATTNQSMTRTGEMIGTPFYMSPEQFLKPKEIDARSDLWSLAVVAYACLTGVLPFKGDTLTAVGMAVATGKFDGPRSHRSDLPGALDHFMERALSTDPAKRYRSAVEFAAAFERATASAPVSLPVPSAPPGSGTHAQLPYASTMPEAARGSALPANVPSAAPPATFDPTHAPLTTLASAPSKSSGSPLKWVAAIGGVGVLLVGAIVGTYLVVSPKKQAASASASAKEITLEISEPDLSDLASALKAKDGPPYPIAGVTWDALLKRAQEEAKKHAKKFSFNNVVLTGVKTDGTMTAESIANFQFLVPTGQCVNVSLQAVGIQVDTIGCNDLKASIPKCTPKAAIAKADPPVAKSALVTLTYAPDGLGGANWLLGGPTRAIIPDKCP